VLLKQRPVFSQPQLRPQPQQFTEVFTMSPHAALAQVKRKAFTAGPGSNTIIAAVASKKLRILFLHGTSNQAASVVFRSGTTALSGTHWMGANQPVVLPWNDGGLMETATGEAFVIDLGAGGFGGELVYQEVT
jgi:hypothetical protein